MKTVLLADVASHTTTTTFVISLGRKSLASVGWRDGVIASIELLGLKLALYYVHERAWVRSL